MFVLCTHTNLESAPDASQSVPGRDLLGVGDKLDLDGLLHGPTQRAILLRSDHNTPSTFGLELDGTRCFTTRDLA